MKKLFFVFVFGALLSFFNTSDLTAQVVNKKPKQPQMMTQRPPKPGPDYVWIEGGWKWNKKKGEYDWEEGKWEKKKEGHSWVPGGWKREGNGYRWEAGHWNKNM